MTNPIKINLDKKVETGARISLVKEDGSTLKNFCVGANWGAIETKNWLGGTQKKAVDLDISLGLFSESGQLLNTIYFGNKTAPGIKHTGDDRTGDVDGDDGLDNEVIMIDLEKIDSKVKYIAVVINSFTMIDFKDIPFASARVYDGTKDRVKEVLGYYEVAKNPEFAGAYCIIMASIYKHNDQWKFRAIGKPTPDSNINQMLSRFASEYI